MDEMEFLLYSLAWGGALALMASGLSLYYSVSKIANFAHGEYATIGLMTYLLLIGAINGFARVRGYDVVNYAAFTASHLWLLVPAFLVGGVVAAATFVAAFWPLMRRGSGPLQLMVVSIGVMFLLRFLLYVAAASYDWLTLPTPSSTEYVAAGIRVSLAEVASIVLAVLAGISIAVFTKKTMIGVSLRAVADNPSLAEANGIDSFRVQLVAWFIGGGLAALGGALMFILTGPPGERPIVELGWMNLLSVFAAAVLGGLGSFYGTLAASFILGLAFNEVAAWLLDVGLESQLALAVPFTITLLTLLFMPQGLAGVDWRRLLRKH